MLVDGDGGELPERATEMLGVVDRNSARLLALIEDLLTLSRIDADAVEDEIATVDVTALLCDAVAAVRPLTERAALGMDVDLDVVGVTLSGDAGQLERVILNLLGNAIKFTPAGGLVRLSARVASGNVEVEVRDDGIGIPWEERPRLFERFFRSSTSKERQIPGTGLGLPIARTIVERHQGTITVRSAPDAGTTFLVTLPGAVSVGAPAAVPAGAGLPATAAR